MNTEQQILCLAARTQLEPFDEARLLRLLHTAPDWEQLWAQGHLHDVLPLLTLNLRRLRDQAPIPAGWLARAERRFYATLMRNTTLADELVRVITALRDAGVESLPVKGIVLAETLYGNLALRPAADLDVLVRSHDLPAARATLSALGFAQGVEHHETAKPHPYHDPQYFRESGRDPICLELHWGLWDPQLFHLDSTILWERSVMTQLRGIETRILSPEDTLLHLAIHRARAPLRLRFACDIAELLRRQGAALDWDYVLRQAQSAGARTAMFSALTLAHEVLGAPLAPGIVPQLGIGWLKRWLLNYTCGVNGLFRPTPPDNLNQWSYGPLRPIVLDDLSLVARGVSAKLARRAWRQLAATPGGRRLAKASRRG